MSHQFKSGVENTFYNEAGTYSISTRVPYIVVDNFPRLGLLTALRFIEWISENPEGVISLPTGKTPEYFIKYTRYLVDNWNRKEVKDILTVSLIMLTGSILTSSDLIVQNALQ